MGTESRDRRGVQKWKGWLLRRTTVSSRRENLGEGRDWTRMEYRWQGWRTGGGDGTERDGCRESGSWSHI